MAYILKRFLPVMACAVWHTEYSSGEGFQGLSYAQEKRELIPWPSSEPLRTHVYSFIARQLREE